MTRAGADEVVEVRLIGVPIPLYRAASEHHDELQREFALLQRSDPDQDSGVPARLLRLIDDLNARFGSFTAEATASLQQALARDDQRIDLVYRVPADVREAALELGALLDEADAFCRAGEHLLTLATPPGPVALRRWFLGEFVAQIDGAAPTPWEESPFAPG